MNARLPRTAADAAVNSDELRRFRDDGAVCLRQATAPYWIERLRCGVERDLCESPRGPYFRDLCADGTAFTDMWRWNVIKDYEDAARYSEAPTLAARLLGAREVSFIDEQERRGHEVMSWDVQPGDALVFDALTVHGNSGNSSREEKIRVALRYGAEDIRYAPRKYPWVFTQSPFADPEDGGRPRGPMFPVVWRSR